MVFKSPGDIYSSIGVQEGTVFVVPKIRYEHKASDYLYLLYSNLIESEPYHIQDVSVFSHIVFVFKKLFNKNVILHYHWFEFQDAKALAGMPWKLLCVWLFKLLRGKIVWTIHNLEPHNRRYLKMHLNIHCWLAAKADVVHIHCLNSVAAVSDRFNIATSKIVVLGHPSFPSTEVSKADSVSFLNTRFGIQLIPNTPTILFFGNISKYKQIEKTIDIVEEQKLHTQVLIAGPIKKSEQPIGSKLMARAQHNPMIHILPKFIEDDWLPYIFGASDLCVFNFDHILTSGSVEMALSYNKPVLAPNLGCISELNNRPNVHLFSSKAEKTNLLIHLIATFHNE